MPLNFGDQTRSGAFDTVWSSAKGLEICKPKQCTNLQRSLVSWCTQGMDGCSTPPGLSTKFGEVLRGPCARMTQIEKCWFDFFDSQFLHSFLMARSNKCPLPCHARHDAACTSGATKLSRFVTVRGWAEVRSYSLDLVGSNPTAVIPFPHHSPVTSFLLLKHFQTCVAPRMALVGSPVKI